MEAGGADIGKKGEIWVFILSWVKMTSGSKLLGGIEDKGMEH